jgi:hypothetical protein
MKRIVAALFVAAAWPCDATAADPDPLPTSPQVLAPTAARDGYVVPTGGAAGRVFGPLRGRLGLAQHVDSDQAAPTPVPVEQAVGAAPCAAGGRACGGSIVAGSPIKEWLFFRPTTGHELPWLRPHPYVGPVTGQFPCSPTACPSCAGAPAYAPRSACAHGLGGLAGRGCRNGDCVPPADDAFAGYKFAAPIAPSVSGRGFAPGAVTSTSYKPTVSPTGVAPQVAPKTGTVLDSFKRTFSKP